MLVCCYARREPINFILLACFTLCEAWMIAGITAFYYTREVILAGAITALVTSALTVYAIKTKTKIMNTAKFIKKPRRKEKNARKIKSFY